MNNLKVDKKVLNIINDANNIDLSMNENDDILINYFNEDEDNIAININMQNNNKLIINMACFISKNINIKINGLISGNNNIIKVIFRGISKENHANVDVCIKAKENTKNNVILEDLKGINENGTITLMPILEVDTDDVDASHYATVGGIDENKLFYLTSKGISKEEAYNILKNVFIYNIFDNDFLKQIQK